MSGKSTTYRDTARFLVPESRRQEVTRGFFEKEIMEGILKMGVEEVLCLQHHPRSGIFEVTFHSARIMDQARRNLVERALAPALRGIRWDLAPLLFTIVVHVFNPHVREEDIVLFLKRHVIAVKDGVKMKDECGYWNGRRRYRVQPRVKADGSGLAFPPRVFSLGPDKGVLFIPEVPASATCWTCGKMGHEGKDCAAKRCRNCDTVGHLAKDCTQSKLCSLCGKSGHLFRGCLLRASSYAAAARGGQQKGEEKGAAKQPEKGKKEDERQRKVQGMAAAASTPEAKPHGGQDGRPSSSVREEESGAGAAAAPEKRPAAGGEESPARRTRTETGAVANREVVEEKVMEPSVESGEEEEALPGLDKTSIRRMMAAKGTGTRARSRSPPKQKETETERREMPEAETRPRSRSPSRLGVPWWEKENAIGVVHLRNIPYRSNMDICKELGFESEEDLEFRRMRRMPDGTLKYRVL